MDKLRVKGLAFSKTGTDDGFKKSVSLHPLLTRGHVMFYPSLVKAPEYLNLSP